MGTSNSSLGPISKTPLVPDWIDSPEDTSPESESDSETPDLNESFASNRFQASRRSFSAFARTNNSNSRDLRRSVSSYVKTAAGGVSKLLGGWALRDKLRLNSTVFSLIRIDGRKHFGLWASLTYQEEACKKSFHFLQISSAPTEVLLTKVLREVLILKRW